MYDYSKPLNLKEASKHYRVTEENIVTWIANKSLPLLSPIATFVNKDSIRVPSPISTIVHLPTVDYKLTPSFKYIPPPMKGFSAWKPIVYWDKIKIQQGRLL